MSTCCGHVVAHCCHRACLPPRRRPEPERTGSRAGWVITAVLAGVVALAVAATAVVVLAIGAAVVGLAVTAVRAYADVERDYRVEQRAAAVTLTPRRQLTR